MVERRWSGFVEKGAQDTFHEKVLAVEEPGSRKAFVVYNSHTEPSAPNHQAGSRRLGLDPDCLERRPPLGRVGTQVLKQGILLAVLPFVCETCREHTLAFNPCVKGILLTSRRRETGAGEQ